MWHLIKLLHVNISQLWQPFESAQLEPLFLCAGDTASELAGTTPVSILPDRGSVEGVCDVRALSPLSEYSV